MSGAGAIVGKWQELLAGQQAMGKGGGLLMSALALPIEIFEFDLEDAQTLVFPDSDGDMVVELPVPIPGLAGMDQVQLDTAVFHVASATTPYEQSIAGGSSADPARTVRPAEAAPGVLQRITIEDFSVPRAAGNTRVVLFDPASSKPYTIWEYDEGDEAVVMTRQSSQPSGDFLHLTLQRVLHSGASGPPFAAAPMFEMPDNSAGLYGPALGGLDLRVRHSKAHGQHKVELELTLSPEQRVGAFRLTLGTASSAGPHKGLPQELATVPWKAKTVTGRWARRPTGLVVSALVGSQPAATVATFDQEVPGSYTEIDYAPGARSLVRAQLNDATNADLGFVLRFAAGSPGSLKVALGTLALRYLRTLSDAEGSSAKLRGDPVTIDLRGVPAGLVPAALSLIIDGSYGAARLVAQSDTPEPAAQFHGYRVAGPVQIARRVPLSTDEQGRRLLRLGLLGRVSGQTEVLATLHDGDAHHIRAPRGAPLSLILAPSGAPLWHRADIPIGTGIGPQPEALWVVVQVSRGVLWWYGAVDPTTAGAPLAEATGTRRTTDGGATWTDVAGRPAVQLHVEHLDPVTGLPPRDEALVLSWAQGVLADDLVGAGAVAHAPPDFRVPWLADAESGMNSALASLAAVQGDADGGLLSLTLSCRRDVDLRLHDVVLTYNPWKARSAAASDSSAGGL